MRGPSPELQETVNQHFGTSFQARKQNHIANYILQNGLNKIKVKVELIDQVEKYKTPGLTVTWKVNGGIEKALSPQREFLLCKCLILRMSFKKGSFLRRTGPRTRIGFFDCLSTFSTSTTIFPSSQSPK